MKIVLEKIINEIANGNENAFTTLFFHHKDRVFTIAFAYTENRFDAEEIVQDTFLRVWKNRHKLPEIENVEAWLFTIARNLSLTVLKRIARQGVRKENAIAYQPTEINDTNELLQRREIQQLLQKALLRLSPQQRRVFELSRLDGMDRADIAAVLDLSPATVSVHLTIALRIVRAFLLGQKEI